MKRGSFLKRTITLILGARLAGAMPAGGPAAAPESLPAAIGAVHEEFFSGFHAVASGGLCAPLKPIYELPSFPNPGRPVRDALPSFEAQRGGISFPKASDSDLEFWESQFS